MEWQVAYDLMETRVEGWWFPLLFLIGLPIGMIMLKYRSLALSVYSRFPVLRNVGEPSLSSIIRYVAIGAIFTSLFGFIFVTTFFYSANSALKKAYDSGDYLEVSGLIEDHKPAQYCVESSRGFNSGNDHGEHGLPTEQFRIDDTTFVYSDYLITGGFHQTTACGGPIVNGLEARVWHVNGVIVRMEFLDR